MSILPPFTAPSRGRWPYAGFLFRSAAQAYGADDFAGMAEFGRELINERTSSGRIQAKEPGVRFGRPPKLTGEQIELAHRLIREGTSVPEASRILKVHRTTLYRALEAGKPMSSTRSG